MIHRPAIFQLISRIKWQVVIIVSTLVLIMIIMHLYDKSLRKLDVRLKDTKSIQIRN